ncbi:MAG: hypothetical protein ACP59X_21075 [Solidesulfovibrio sp. DCME]|uniref:hypothetical protein n=1 Tax=Solidesulfovibrio sp. DCME TaxID=3447380 RepID=UPI003D10B96E
MTESALFLKLIESIGFPALIFAVWYLYHRSQVKAWESQLATQAKAWEEQMKAMNVREERVFSLLTGQLEALQCVVAQNARMESKIDTNQWCPLVKKEMHHAG